MKRDAGGMAALLRFLWFPATIVLVTLAWLRLDAAAGWRGIHLPWAGWLLLAMSLAEELTMNPCWIQPLYTIKLVWLMNLPMHLIMPIWPAFIGHAAILKRLL